MGLARRARRIARTFALALAGVMRAERDLPLARTTRRVVFFLVAMLPPAGICPAYSGGVSVGVGEGCLQ